MAAETVIWVGRREFDVAVDAILAAADIANKAIVTEGGQVIRAAAAAHVSGRPGPEVRSGALRSSIRVDKVEQVAPGVWRSETGPTVPYGRRIELGFHGQDSRGRHYDQGPFPYLAPGAREAVPALQSIYLAAWAAALQAR